MRHDADVAYYFNKIVHVLLSGIHRTKKFELLITLVYPILVYFQAVPINNFDIIRGIVHMFQGTPIGQVSH